MLINTNGVHLNFEQSGEGPALLALHGFTGSGRSLLSFARAWPGFTMFAADVIGHGESDSPDDPRRYSMDACIADLVELMDVLGLGKVALLGYSMGGRIALRFALAHPDRLWGLVLESASGGIEDEAERQARIESDEKLAQRLEDDGLEAFVDYWESIPLWASQSRLPQEKRDTLRQQRLRNNPKGLANSLRGMGAGADVAIYDKLTALRVPALLIAGELDEKYRDMALRMASRIPEARAVIIPDAGHAAHFEQPEAFAEVVLRFLQMHAPVTARRTSP
jgi:2-succinyl-6-hydroxy-2,4-cyclohexadiene-1-carboxylate synthase